MVVSVVHSIVMIVVVVVNVVRSRSVVVVVLVVGRGRRLLRVSRHGIAVLEAEEVQDVVALLVALETPPATFGVVLERCRARSEVHDDAPVLEARSRHQHRCRTGGQVHLHLLARAERLGDEGHGALRDEHLVVPEAELSVARLVLDVHLDALNA